MTRSLVTTDTGANLFDPIIQFTEWIQARTEFIDEALDAFLESPVCKDSSGAPLECNVVLFGAGYDTRALRFRHAHDHKINLISNQLSRVKTSCMTNLERRMTLNGIENAMGQSF